VGELPDHDQHEDADDRHQAHELGEDLEHVPVPETPQRELGREQLPVRVDQGQDEGAEADHDEPVRGADDAPAEHAGVPDRLGEHRAQALAGRVGPAADGLPEFDEREDVCGGAPE
jgi:hypothetical protein